MSTVNASAAYYMGDGSEHYATSGHEFKPCETPGCKTVGELMGDFWSILAPIFVEYGVDLYNAGHVHSYEASFPVCKDSHPCQQNYINPKGPVHITEGNGGVPGVAGSVPMCESLVSLFVCVYAMAYSGVCGGRGRVVAKGAWPRGYPEGVANRVGCCAACLCVFVVRVIVRGCLILSTGSSVVAVSSGVHCESAVIWHARSWCLYLKHIVCYFP